MTLNLRRALFLRAAGHMLGAAAAASPAPLGAEWFDAIAQDEFEAADLAWETNSQRAQASVIAKGR